jgi:hypothetical protein
MFRASERILGEEVVGRSNAVHLAMSFLRKPRLTYANVISTLALFVALGGASYAASGALAPGSVGTKQLHNGAVTPPKLAFGYQSGAFSSGLREIPIGYSCSGHAAKCVPPVFRPIGSTRVRLSRRARLAITVTSSVTNNSSRTANVALLAGTREEGGSPCVTQTFVPAQNTGTVTCTGATGILPPGTYHLDAVANADARISPTRASANQTSIVWWTLPPNTKRH